MRNRFNRRWATLALVVIAVCVAVGAWLFLRTDGPQPVVSTNLETNALERFLGRGAWRDLGFRLTPQHADATKRCQVLSQKVRSTINGVSAFAAEESREELQKIVAAAPDLFYAEYLLGLWHEMNGKSAAADAHYAKALELAPVILVQRFEFADGRPLVGVEIPEIEVECNRVEGGWLDPSLKLVFFKVKTDPAGSVRLPVYKTVYRLTSTTDPVGFDSHWPITGWFQSRGRTGLLPTATVTRKAPGDAERP